MLRRGDRAPLGRSTRGEPTGLFEGPCRDARALSAAHPLAGRGAGDRRSLFLRPAARRARPASVQRGPPFRAGRGARRQRHDASTACAACASRSGRRTPSASPWSAISMPGMRGAIRCGCAIARASGSCSCRASAPGARYKFDIVGAGGVRLPQKADPLAQQTEPPPATASVVAAPRAVPLERRRLDGARAPRARRRTRRSRSTRCISAPGCGRARRRPRLDCGTSRPTGSSPTSPTWASPMSSCCRSPSIRSAARGATSRSACSRRARASARPKALPASSMRCMPPASASSSTGCRRISRPIRTAWRASTARRSTSISIRARASTATGTPTSTISAGARCRAS